MSTYTRTSTNLEELLMAVLELKARHTTEKMLLCRETTFEMETQELLNSVNNALALFSEEEGE
jgi:hypothetical protein